MSSLPILDLVAGVIFFYFLLSIISSSAVEMTLTVFQLRAKVLEDWLKTIFDKPFKQPDGTTIPLGQAIMDHCSVTALSEKGKSTSYIDAKNFAAALLERITYDPQNPVSIARNIDELIVAIQRTTLLPTELQRVILTYAYEAKNTYASLSVKVGSEVDLFRSKVENWFDMSMDRIGGTLKRKYTRRLTFVIGVATVLLLNADSIAISKYLYSNPDARARFAASAYAEVKSGDHLDSAIAQLNTTAANTIRMKLKEIERVKDGLSEALPIGWKAGELREPDGHLSGRLLFSKITGLLATILAIMLGASFWFDLLSKIADLRGTGAKPVSSTGGDNK